MPNTQPPPPGAPPAAGPVHPGPVASPPAVGQPDPRKTLARTLGVLNVAIISWFACDSIHPSLEGPAAVACATALLVIRAKAGGMPWRSKAPLDLLVVIAFVSGHLSIWRPDIPLLSHPVVAELACYTAAISLSTAMANIARHHDLPNIAGKWASLRHWQIGLAVYLVVLPRVLEASGLLPDLGIAWLEDWRSWSSFGERPRPVSMLLWPSCLIAMLIVVVQFVVAPVLLVSKTKDALQGR